MTIEPKATNPELVFGLVGAVGTDLELVENALNDALQCVNYTVERVRLSSLLEQFPFVGRLPSVPEEARLAAYMDAGNQLREKTGRGDALALLAVTRIRRIRRESHLGDELAPPIPRCAYVLRSLKHDAEVDRLRRIYGPGFFLVAAYSPYTQRRQRLAGEIARSHESADSKRFISTAAKLIDRDRFEEGSPFGQRVRETFKKADVFVDAGDPIRLRSSMQRFVEILFRHPNHTPLKAEHAMFHAHASAVRSASLARQVGAAIVSADGEILAAGTNEVPKPGGGLYWPDDGDSDARDFRRGYDSNARMKIQAVREVLELLGKAGWLKDDFSTNSEEMKLMRLDDACDLLDEARVMNLTEFGREVHAEMAALLDAARRGVSVRGARLYCTTFPCHNCAKHIVAAGIREVFYIEPYPKSVAPELYDDSIAVDPDDSDESKVPFRPFVGIGARRYMDLFSMVNSEGWSVDRKDGKGVALQWIPEEAFPRLPMWDRSYLERESIALEKFEEKVDSLMEKEATE